MGVLKVWDGSAWQTIAAGLSDSGWADLTNEDPTNWDILVGGGDYRKLNGVVYLQVEFQRLGAAIGTNSAFTATIATLPVGFRPTRQLIFPMTTGDPGSSLHLRILLDGSISIRNKSTLESLDTGQFVQAAVSYIPA